MLQLTDWYEKNCKLLYDDWVVLKSVSCDMQL